MTFSLELSYLKVIDVRHPYQAICAAQEMLGGMCRSSIFAAPQNVTVLSLSVTISYRSRIVDKGHISEPSDWRILRQLPQANISPPASLSVLICSVTTNLLVSRDSHSTPLPSRNTFTQSPFASAKFPNRKAFQTVSESSEWIMIPIFMVSPYNRQSTVIRTFSDTQAMILATPAKHLARLTEPARTRLAADPARHKRCRRIRITKRADHPVESAHDPVPGARVPILKLA